MESILKSAARRLWNNWFREVLAAFAHEQWSGWMRYLFEKGERDEYGNFVILMPEFVRWTRQMNTPYAELSNEEQESDRRQADKMLTALCQAIVENDNRERVIK